MGNQDSDAKTKAKVALTARYAPFGLWGFCNRDGLTSFFGMQFHTFFVFLSTLLALYPGHLLSASTQLRVGDLPLESFCFVNSKLILDSVFLQNLAVSKPIPTEA